MEGIKQGPESPERKRRTADELLNEARMKLAPRLSPTEAHEAMQRGVLLVDIRDLEQRQRDGLIPGAVVIERNVLEWRLDPHADNDSRNEHVRPNDYEQPIIILCNQGYQSGFAAEKLVEMGFEYATDVKGGFEAWVAAGLPVQPQEQEQIPKK